MPSDNQLHELLQRARTIAIVGLSDDPRRPSHAVASYLRRNGYRVIPVNPNLNTPLFGEQPVANVHQIREHVDVVAIFRRPEFVVEAVEDAIAVGADAVWMQLGVVNHEAAQLARSAGIAVVMDQCMAIEHRRLSRYAEYAEAEVLV